MSGTESHHSNWSEEDVDALLRDFFRKEMPAELRELRPRPAASTPRASGNPSTGSVVATQTDTKQRAGRLNLAVVVGTLSVAVVLILASSPSKRIAPDETASRDKQPVVPIAVVAPSGTESVEANATLDGALLDGDRSWHPAVIPVELRKFAPGLLINSGSVEPRSTPGKDYGITEHFGFPDEDEEGKPKNTKKRSGKK